MLKLQNRNGRYSYSIFLNPVSRVMKFKRFAAYFASLPKGECIVDYGAGDRPLEPMLRTKFSRYIAADYPPSNAAHAQRPDILITEDSIDMESATADCVVLTEVMEHLYDPKAVLAEIKRVLKPGGALIGTVPFALGEHEQPYDFHRYTSFCLRRMFEETGLEIVHLEYVGDSVGVAVSSFTRVLGIFVKALHKLKLAPIAHFVNIIFRLPEMLYYGLVQIGLNPGRVGYYKAYPFGFTFHVVKPAQEEG